MGKAHDLLGILHRQRANQSPLPCPNPVGLIPHIAAGFAAHGDVHSLQRGVQTAAEFDLAALDAESLRLEVEQD
jgi:hypothetical protein